LRQLFFCDLRLTFLTGRPKPEGPTFAASQQTPSLSTANPESGISHAQRDRARHDPAWLIKTVLWRPKNPNKNLQPFRHFRPLGRSVIGGSSEWLRKTMPAFLKKERKCLG
jgi:hypothetical protein